MLMGPSRQRPEMKYRTSRYWFLRSLPTHKKKQQCRCALALTLKRRPHLNRFLPSGLQPRQNSICGVAYRLDHFSCDCLRLLFVSIVNAPVLDSRPIRLKFLVVTTSYSEFLGEVRKSKKRLKVMRPILVVYLTHHLLFFEDEFGIDINFENARLQSAFKGITGH